MTTTPPTRLLVVDDEELNRDMLSRRLTRYGYEVVTVSSGPEALAAVERDAFDALLVDVMMPDMSGLEVLRRLREQRSAEQLPILMVTARAQSQDVVEALDLGANDYVTKPIDMQVMLARIRTQVAHRRADQNLRESHARLALAVEGNHDALTGVPTRAWFADRVSRLLEHARRVPDFEFAVLMIDLDRFKNVNETLGYPAGDRLLVEAARRLERVVGQDARALQMHGPWPASGRVVDNMVGRLGGDEFAVLVSGVRHPRDASRAADRILEAFSSPFEIDGHTVFATVSIGVALSASGYEGEQEMLRDADIALVRAKEAGRACAELFDAGMREQVEARLQLETDLRWALGRGELVLEYQPIIALADETVSGLEALVRWRHPQRGMLLPADFIPVAEETGLVVPIGYWVFREVCRQLHEWSTAHGSLSRITIAVNLSGRHLQLPHLAERLGAIAREFGVDTSRIELELPERCLTPDVEATRGAFHALKAQGFRLTIDDFGSGYSSLQSLRRFPVDRLKIDRAFFGESPSAPESDVVMKSMIDLMHHFDMEVVAEGIERPRQLAQVTTMRCGYGQGYLLSRPITPSSVEELLLPKRG
jgi:predicted signal transduction protein with EAL and GGDEF domain